MTDEKDNVINLESITGGKKDVKREELLAKIPDLLNNAKMGGIAALGGMIILNESKAELLEKNPELYYSSRYNIKTYVKEMKSMIEDVEKQMET